MWKVKMLKTWARAEGIVQANEEISVDEKTAKEIIENGSAILIFKPLIKRKIETATVKPKERALKINNEEDVVEVPVKAKEAVKTKKPVKKKI